MTIRGLGYDLVCANIIKHEMANVEAARARAADLTAQLGKYAPASVRELVRLSKFKGSESANIIINAMGTTAAALPIYFNPLSEADDDTLFYMCMRQPISALVAFATQIPATMWLTRKISEHHNIGYCSPQYDKRIVQDEKFILRQLKKENKKSSSPATLEELQKKAKTIRANQEYNAIADMLREGTFVTKDSNGKIVYRLPDEDFQKLMTDVVDNYIKGNEETLGRYSGEKQTKQTVRGIFIHDNPELVDNLFNEIKEAYNANKNACDETVESKELVKWFKEKIKLVKKNGIQVEQQVEILQDLHDRRTPVAIAQKISELEVQISQFKHRIDPESLAFERIQSEKAGLKNKIKLATIIKEMIANNADMKDIILKARELEGINFSYDVLQKHRSRIASAGGYKSAIVGLLASFVITFGTCSVLNWVYPKIMDLFPSVKEAKRKTEIKKRSYDDQVAFSKRAQNKLSDTSAKEVKHA